MHLLCGAAGSGSLPTVEVTLTASTHNIYTAAGSPAAASAVTATVPAGVIIGWASGAQALTTGAWPAGSTMLIINNGFIEGRGGNGDTAGGNALNLTLNASVDNTNGYIRGGGGGGATGPSYSECGGGGGGGGQGNPGGTGASGGGGAQGNGQAGGSGSRTSNGGGGAAYSGIMGVHGGDGGNGGAWGGSGASSGADTGGNVNNSVGAAGKAVALNGKSISWLGGNNATQVKGAVS